MWEFEQQNLLELHFPNFSASFFLSNHLNGKMSSKDTQIDQLLSLEKNTLLNCISFFFFFLGKKLLHLFSTSLSHFFFHFRVHCNSITVLLLLTYTHYLAAYLSTQNLNSTKTLFWLYDEFPLIFQQLCPTTCSTDPSSIRLFLNFRFSSYWQCHFFNLFQSKIL